jgi:two-component system response regulator (stage 0 sporulation protein F)
MSDSRILVVDDEERTRTYICDGLSALGITDNAVCAATAEEALAEADRAPVDLVISDVRMPGLNGLDLIRYLRQSHPNTRVILITGYSTRDIERTALSLAVEALLKKPFALEALGQAVRAALISAHSAAPIILPADSMETISRQIGLLKRDTGAQWIALFNSVGQIVAETDPRNDVDETLRTIDQRGWTTMLTSISGQSGPCFLYIEGQPHDIYLTCVDQNH